MALIVQKYGGTSVADPERIRAVAEHVAFTKRHGNDVVVVVSAMGKSTDNLIKLANDVSSVQPARELDMLLTTGERISMTLVCMALAGVGIDAISFTGSQVGIITDTVHTKAKILEVKGVFHMHRHQRKQRHLSLSLSLFLFLYFPHSLSIYLSLSLTLGVSNYRP